MKLSTPGFHRNFVALAFSAVAFGAAVATSPVSAQTDLNGSNLSVPSLSGSGTYFNSQTGTTGVLTVGSSNDSTTYSGTIEDNTGTGGQVALVVNMGSTSSPGTLQLTGANTYTGVVISGDTGGDTLIKNGTLEISTTNTLPTSTNVWLNSDGGTTPNDGSGTANLAIDASTNQTVRNLTFVSPLFNNNDTSLDGTSQVTIGTGGTLTVTGSISLVNNTSGAGNGAAVDIEGGTLDLSGHTTVVTVASQDYFPGFRDMVITSQIVDGGINYTGTPSGTPASLNLNAVNTYALGTTINEGALITGSKSSSLIGGVSYSQSLGTGFVNNSGATGPSFLATYTYNYIEAANPALSVPTAAQNILIGTTGTPASYTQGANATLDLGVLSSVAGTPSAANDFDAGVAGVNYDTVTVTGTATSLAGKLTLAFAPGTTPYQGQHYVVLTSDAGPVGTTSTFSGDTIINLPSDFSATLTYNDTFGGTEPADSVIVTLAKTINMLSSFSGLTSNQMSVAVNIDKYVALLSSQPNDFLSNVYPGLTTASQNGTLGAALDQLSPQRYEILQNVAFDNYALDVQSLDDQFARERNGVGGIDTSGFTFNDSALGPELSEIKGRLMAWSPAPEPNGLLSDSSPSILGGADMSAPKDMKETVASTPLNTVNGFIDGGADLGDLDSNADSSHASYTTARVRAGIDYRISTTIRVGALFGYGHTDADLDNEGSKAHIDSYTPGLYLTYADKSGFYANALFTGTLNDYSTDRDIIIPGINRTATGSTSGVQWGGDIDGGYEFHQGAWTFGPSAGLTYVNLGIDSFNENGAGAANLNVGGQSNNSLRSRLGGTVSYNFKAGSVVVTPHLSAFWQHEFLDPATNLTSQLEGSPAGAFNVSTISGDRDNALLGFGIDADLNKTVTLFLDYQAEAGGSSFFGQSAEGGAKLGF